MDTAIDQSRVGTPAGFEAEPREGECSEPERGEAQEPAGAAPSPGTSETEVRPRARRRTFTAEYKLRILHQADACKRSGELGALLRREGLYSSHLAAWRRDRERGAMRSLARKKRGPKGASPESKRVAELEQENQRLREELRRAQLINDAQKKLSELLGGPAPVGQRRREGVMAAEQLAADLGNVSQACTALDVARSGLYRDRKPRVDRPTQVRPTPARALSLVERQTALDALHEERFVDLAPPQVYAQLLEERRYLCSIRTMYRILEAEQEVKERRAVRRQQASPKPCLVARAPNVVWTWDISKLAGPAKGIWFNLYVVLDLYSRYVVAWMIAHKALARLARRLLREAFLREGVAPGQLTVHSDRGAQMVARSVTDLWATLGVVPSLSRPRVPDDNPFSESQFRTLKDRPDFPDRFGSIQHARHYGSELFDWYNNRHHHSGLGLLTPATVHHGKVDKVLTQRRTVLHAAYAAHPDRFVHGPPEPRRPPEEVWINQPPAATFSVEEGH